MCLQACIHKPKKPELMPFIKTCIFKYKYPRKKASCDTCVFTVSRNMNTMSQTLLWNKFCLQFQFNSSRSFCQMYEWLWKERRMNGFGRQGRENEDGINLGNGFRKPSSIVSKRMQEHISMVHCLMDVPEAGSWDIGFVSLRNRHLWDERKQMDVTDSTLTIFSRGLWNCT